MHKILPLGVTDVRILPLSSNGRKEIMEALKEILIKNEWFTKQEVKEIFSSDIVKCIDECTRPRQDEIFNAFNGLRPQDVKVLIIGQDPYPQKGRADGLAFSFGNNEEAQDSLKNIFDKLKELGIDNKNTKLTKWKKNGILLLNSSLTFKYYSNKSEQTKSRKKHLEAWQPFIKQTLTKLFEKRTKSNPLVVMLWGKNANLIEKFNNGNEDDKYLKKNIYIIRNSHPSNLGGAKNYCGNYANPNIWVNAFMCKCNNPFKKCNEFFKLKGLPEIDWSTDKNLSVNFSTFLK